MRLEVENEITIDLHVNRKVISNNGADHSISEGKSSTSAEPCCSEYGSEAPSSFLWPWSCYFTRCF